MLDTFEESKAAEESTGGAPMASGAGGGKDARLPEGATHSTSKVHQMAQYVVTMSDSTERLFCVCLLRPALRRCRILTSGWWFAFIAYML